ncbi:MAG: queuosine precursor transporter [Candidatus Kapaibacteriales bacterium]
MENKSQTLFLVLAAFFITNALLAELIGVKIFSFESTFGLPALGFGFLGYVLDLNFSAGVILWPAVFITTDIINEYFGKAGVRKISFVTVGCIIFAFAAIAIVRWLSPAEFWVQIGLQSSPGGDFDINYAFDKIFGQSLGIIVGSLIAFLIGQFLDVAVFQRLRKLTGEKAVWLRATGSTLVSQLVDSFVVLFVAFYILSPKGFSWELSQVFSVGTLNYIYKFIVAIALTPVIYIAHSLIDRYLGTEQAEKIKAKAASSTFIT